VENLSVAYGDQAVLHAFELTMHRGQSLALVGESGSGKSTAVLALLGLLPAAGRIIGGRVLFEGRDLVTLSTDQLASIRGRQIAVIFQDPAESLNPLRSAGSQVAEALLIHERCSRREAVDRTLTALIEAGLPNPKLIYDRYPHQLSGGMRQRVLIAMALINHPALLIADEPTTALDVTMQAAILAHLTNLCKNQGMALLIITHDLAVVAQVAQHAIVLLNGRVVESGPVERLLHQPAADYTRRLIAARESLEVGL